jgi:carbon monoxide dehydrogenase subunit G
MIELANSFTVPASPEETWRVLADIERVASCMPGLRLDAVVGNAFEGSFKVKLGVMAVTYRGTAALVEHDAGAHRAAVNASATETRGHGRATATARLSLAPVGLADNETEVAVLTALEVTGPPTRLGGDVVARVADRLAGQFARRLREELAHPRPEPAADIANAPVPRHTADADPPDRTMPAPARVAASRRVPVTWAAVAAGAAVALMVAIRTARRRTATRSPDGGSR